jgi:hypothetical protein
MPVEREGAGAAEARSRPPATGEARRRGGRGGGQGGAMGGPPEQGRATAGAAAEQGRRKNEQGFAGKTSRASPACTGSSFLWSLGVSAN